MHVADLTHTLAAVLQMMLMSFLMASVSLNQDELKLALKQGTTLLGCIKEQAAKSENHKLNPDEMENQTTVER